MSVLIDGFIVAIACFLIFSALRPQPKQKPKNAADDLIAAFTKFAEDYEKNGKKLGGK